MTLSIGELHSDTKRRPPMAAPSAWFGRRHLARRTVRTTLFVLGDSGVLLLFANLIGTLQEGDWLPLGLADAFDSLFPRGALESPGFTFGVLLCLILLGPYGAATRGQAERRRLVAAVLGLALLAWSTFWENPGLLPLSGYLVLVSTLGLLLVFGGRAIEALLRRVVPLRLRTARVLLVAGDGDMQRADQHPAVSDRAQFVVKGVFNPQELRGRAALEELCGAVRRADADTIILCCGALCDTAFRVVLDAATCMGCGLVSLARSTGGAGLEPRMLWTRGTPLMVLASPAVRTLQLVVKRSVDIVGATLLLLAFFPVMLVIVLVIRLEGHGPIFFGQRRIGAGGRPFRCYKFRSMRIDAEELLRRDPVLHEQYVKNNFKLPEGRDPRITRLGRILRMTSLDELPQLWNVLRGDMSLVGPRPIVPAELGEYAEKSRVLLSLKPGIAGAWAVNGRSRVGYPDRAELELGYVRSWRFGLDLSILVRTLPAVLSRRGAH